jgi:hypothetical protein
MVEDFLYMAIDRLLGGLCVCTLLISVCTAQKQKSSPATEPVANKTSARPRVFERGEKSPQIVASGSMVPAQLSTASFRPASGEEIEGMELTLEKYESAFENLSLVQMREIWPSLDRQHERAFKSVFAGFHETAWTRHLGLECTTPKVTGESANVDCLETLVYANAKGKSKEVGPARIAVLLKRQSSAWVVEDMKGE